MGIMTISCFHLVDDPIQIQVVEDDRKNRSGVFQSTPQSSDPPLVTTDFYTEDQGMVCVVNVFEG